MQSSYLLLYDTPLINYELINKVWMTGKYFSYLPCCVLPFEYISTSNADAFFFSKTQSISLCRIGFFPLKRKSQQSYLFKGF